MVKGYPLSDKVGKEEIPSSVVFVDTETEEAADGRLSLLLGCYEVWQVDDVGLPQERVEEGTFTTEETFYGLISKYADCRVVAHNWTFDAAVLRVGATSNAIRYGYAIDVENGIYPVGQGQYAPFLLRLNFDHGYAEFLCNTNFYKSSLARIGESLKVPKLEMPPVTDIPAMVDYCANDVRILRMAYFAVFSFTQEIADTTPGITTAMAANRVYRKAYYTREKTVQGSQHIGYVNASERAAYHGGRTDTFFKGTPNAEVVYKYDVNSLYPSCMLGNIPIRYSQRGKTNWIERMGDDLIALADVSVNIPPKSAFGFLGVEGVKDEEGQLIFPVGSFRVWAWQPILEILLENGYIAKVHNVLLYESEALFKTYINEMFAHRQRYKADGNAAFDTLTKLLMNSLYGKFAQRENDRWRLVDLDSNEYAVMAEPSEDMRRFSEEYEGAEYEYWQQGNDLWAIEIKEVRHLARSAVCSIAGYITAKGRAVLWRAMADILSRGGQVYMCDTDSVVTNMTLPDHLVSETVLGLWKEEAKLITQDSYFYAPKHYFMDGKLVLKGVRKPTDGSEHPQEVFPNFMTDLTSKNPTRRERLESGAVIKHIVKRPTGYNGKRIEQGENLPTLPIVLDL